MLSVSLRTREDVVRCVAVCSDRYDVLTCLLQATGSKPNVASHVSTSVAIVPILFDWLSRDGGSRSNIIEATMIFNLPGYMTSPGKFCIKQA